MLFSQDRNQMRQFFFDSWQKHNQGQPLEPLETLIAAVIQQHPEYHRLLDDREACLTRDYLPENGETNPFLHLGMHIAIQEQLATGRPAGIIEIHDTLRRQLQSEHEAEHAMMDCLAEMMWRAQRDQAPPDEDDYLRCLRRKCR